MSFQFSVLNEKNLVCMGDSLTAERTFQAAFGGALLNQTYAALMSKSRGYGNFWNAGISGHTTAQMLARFSTDVLAHHAGAVSIMGFTNDQTTNITGTYPSLTWTGAGIPLTGGSSTKSNLKSMVQQAQASRARVTLLSPPPIRYEPYLTHSPDYLDILEEIVDETGCEYIDVYTRVNALSAAEQDALYITVDLLGHWGAAGHAFLRDMAEEVGNELCFAQY